jgi:hypothetical protein
LTTIHLDALVAVAVRCGQVFDIVRFRKTARRVDAPERLLAFARRC